MTRLTWSQYALNLARAASTRSEDPHRQVGACLLRHDRSIASVGYNGAPPGVEIDWTDRDARRAQVIHAEANALRFVKPGEAVLLASTMMPCSTCVLMASAYGVRKIVYLQELDPAVYDAETIRALAAMCRIELVKEEPA